MVRALTYAPPVLVALWLILAADQLTFERQEKVLLQTFLNADRLEIYTVTRFGHASRNVLEVRDRRGIARLASLLRPVDMAELPETSTGYWLGGTIIETYRGQRRIGSVGLHHGRDAVRWFVLPRTAASLSPSAARSRQPILDRRLPPERTELILKQLRDWGWKGKPPFLD